MVLLTTGFGEFEFPPTFSLLLLLNNKNAGKFKLKSLNIKKCGKFKIAKPSKSSGKFKFLKSISYITFALALGDSTSADLDRMDN